MIGLPECVVQIWPADGGMGFLSSANGGILSCRVTKDLWDVESGTFELVIAPGGPFNSLDSNPQWVDAIPVMSLVTIGMQRGGEAHIVMIGIVTDVMQHELWNPGQSVERALRVTGRDFSYFFCQSSSYSQLLLRFGSAALLGEQGALSAGLQIGVASGAPEFLAQQFYNIVMAGTGGLMSGTQLQFDGAPLKFVDVLETSFQKYDPNLPIQVPSQQNFAALDGTWNDTFLNLFPFPWYEYFVTTAEPGQFGQPDASQTISIVGRPTYGPANPAVIARPSPLPKLTNPNGPLMLDVTAWNQLPTFAADTIISHSEAFTLNDVRNFFAFNPSFLATLFGGQNDSLTSFVMQFGTWIDVQSIQRYGYRPRVDTLDWFADSNGNQAKQNASNVMGFQQAVGQLALRPIAFHEPSPLMTNSVLTTTLHPEATIGTRCQYQPNKESETWLAYIRSVEHNFQFGGPSTTTLGLCRGLPAAVYADTSGLLLAIFTGRASRVNGQYMVNTNQGVTPLTTENAQQELVSLAQAFNTPGQM